jgi:hypothetical protein
MSTKLWIHMIEQQWAYTFTQSWTGRSIEVVSLTRRPLYSRGKSPIPTEKKAEFFLALSGRGGKEENSYIGL